MDKETDGNLYRGQSIRRTGGRSVIIWGCHRDERISDSDENPYEVPMPPPLTVMSSVNPTAPVDFVTAATTNNDTVQHQSIVLPSSPHEEQQEGAEGGNDQTLPKTVEGEIAIPPPQGWLPPISRSYIREKSHHF